MHEPPQREAAAEQSVEGPATAGGRLLTLRRWVLGRERLWWWLHSMYALALGLAVMWIGQRHYGWLRLTFAYIALIWASSLVTPALLAARWMPARWHGAVRLLVNYFQKNFYQQLLFFVLPIYWASATPGARNMWFVVLVALSAVLSTFDVVYDRHLAVKRPLTASFFAFNVFACVNVTLPVIWSVSNAHAMRWSAGLAAFGFVTVLFGTRMRRYRRGWKPLLAGLVMLAVLVEFGRPWVPPAPLRLVDPAFGTALRERTPPRLERAISSLPAGYSGRVYVVTPIAAPLGLRDRVRHVWYVDGRLASHSNVYEVVGGRGQGYRLWTSLAVQGLLPRSEVRVDVETAAGQLIGRARLAVP